jgi:hypothetical protein
MVISGTRMKPNPKMNATTAVMIINTLNFMAFPP